MEPLLIRLLIAIGVIWLVQTILSALSIKEPANKAIFLLTLLLCIVFVVAFELLPR